MVSLYHCSIYRGVVETKYHHEFRAVYRLTVHIVFVCKYRRRLLKDGGLERVMTILKETCAKWGCTVLEVNGEPDHIHLIIDYPPKIALSNFIANLKTVSSRLYRKEFNLRHALWTGSYFVASCGGAPLEKIRQYVENQDRNGVEGADHNSSTSPPLHTIKGRLRAVESPPPIVLDSEPPSRDRPLPPDILADALQEPCHTDTGISRAARARREGE